MKRGDVVLVLFPHSDLRTAKTRPALVVQADDLETGLPQVIVAMVTGQMSRAGHHESDGWANLALAAGYYDQAHMTNDFRRWTGLAPGRYLAERSRA